MNFIQGLIGRATDTEAKHREFLRQFPGLHDFYFRLQDPSSLGEIDLAATEKLDEIERIAWAYVRSVEGLNAIKQCARRLAQKVQLPQEGLET